MSRSSRKTPKRGITSAVSEKQNKLHANRRFRRKTKSQIKGGETDLIQLKEDSNVWGFDKDGKQFLHNPSKKDLRK